MSILQMSIYGSILIIVIFLIRMLFINKIPKKTFVLLWGIAICRLLIPFALPSKISIYSLLQDEIGAFSESLGTIIETKFFLSPSEYHSRLPKVNILESTDFWVVMWIVGAVFLLAIFLIYYFENMRKFQESLPVENEFIENWIKRNTPGKTFEIRISDRITSPLVYGFFHPIILLPKSINFKDEESLKFILSHEITHIERYDFLKKILLNLTLCIQWFNPLVWMMYIMANRDIEISCDENVVKKIGRELKSSYALTLVTMAERSAKLNILNLGFSKYAVKERISYIMKMKKISFWGIILAFMLVLSTTAVFATTQEIDFLRVETILPTINNEANAIPWNELREHGVDFSFYFRNDELFINNFYNLYEITSLKPILPQFEGVYSVGFRLDDKFEYITEIRLNYDGEWMNEAEFKERYPGHTFMRFIPAIKSYVTYLKTNFVKVAPGYYVSPENYEKALQLIGQN